MKIENTEIETAIFKAYFTALKAERNASHKAQQTGAWLITSLIATSDQTFEEAVQAVRDALKEEGWPVSTINNSLPLVPFASKAYAADSEKMPAVNQWPSKGYCEDVLACSSKSPADATGIWDSLEGATRKEAVADIKVDFKSSGVPDKKPTEDQIAGRLRSMAREKRDRKNGKASGLLDNIDKLREQLVKLTDDQLDTLEEMIEAVRDARAEATS